MSPSSFQDHYFVLEIQSTATAYEVKKAYHRLALLCHPDKNQDSNFSTERFKKISAAWEILKDKTTREIYDREYTAHQAKKRFYGSTSESASPRHPHFYSQTENTPTNQELREETEWRIWKDAKNLKIKALNDEIKEVLVEIQKLDQKNREDELKIKESGTWWSFFSNSFGGKKCLTNLNLKDMESQRRIRIGQRNLQMRKLSHNTEERRKLYEELSMETSKFELRQSQLRRQRELQAQREKEAREEKQRRERLEKMKKEHEERKEREKQEHQRCEQERKERMEQEEAKRARKLKERLENKLKTNSHGMEQNFSQPSENKFTYNTEETFARFNSRFNHKTKRSHFNKPTDTTKVCRHNSFWAKIERPAECMECGMLKKKFIFRCPLCRFLGCATCMKAMKEAGRKM
ncbi:hypothetical protein O181_000855 [Austropuccinia psidii MF-1]|uniref:J domain-containing protein n=1 Tax=Austropuccinia psidii MF-1 TaxID=1389203 RepID=A0A9Q3GB97_9BASI|nr:hypothetical protein [Austropuccinia psidii MF-1]